MLAGEPGMARSCRNLPGQHVFTCLSHDILVHEAAHALVHRQRARFKDPTNLDVYAFHEGFADIVALFQHFTMPGLVNRYIQENRADLTAVRPGHLSLRVMFQHGRNVVAVSSRRRQTRSLATRRPAGPAVVEHQILDPMLSPSGHIEGRLAQASTPGAASPSDLQLPVSTLAPISVILMTRNRAKCGSCECRGGRVG
jgi:hypothetical protein